MEDPYNFVASILYYASIVITVVLLVVGVRLAFAVCPRNRVLALIILLPLPAVLGVAATVLAQASHFASIDTYSRLGERGGERHLAALAPAARSALVGICGTILLMPFAIRSSFRAFSNASSP